MAKKNKSRNSNKPCKAKLREQKHLHWQVRQMLEVIASSYTLFWEKHKNYNDHQKFKAQAERYLGVKILGVSSQDYLPATRDANILHSPLAGDINHRMFVLKQTHDDMQKRKKIQKAIQKLATTCLIKGKFRYGDLQRDASSIFAMIWGKRPITYKLSKKKNNTILMNEVMATLLASVAYFAGVDNAHSASNEVKMRECDFSNWLSLPAVAIGIECARAVQMPPPMGQLALGIQFKQFNEPELLAEDADNKHTIKNIHLKNMKKLFKEPDQIAEKHFYVDLVEQSGQLEFVEFYEVDTNGFGVKRPHSNVVHLDVVKTAVKAHEQFILADKHASITNSTPTSGIMMTARVLYERPDNVLTLKISLFNQAPKAG